MEKRVLLAMLLSLGVLIAFQAIISSKRSDIEDISIETKHVANNILIESKANASAITEQDEKIQGDDEFIEETSVLDGDGLRIQLTNKGGVVNKVESKDMGYALPVKKFINLTNLDKKQFNILYFGKSEIIYQFKSAIWDIKKQYRIEDKRIFSCIIKIKNISDNSALFLEDFTAFIIDISRMDENVIKTDWTLFEYSINTFDKIIRKNSLNSFNKKWDLEQKNRIKWFGFRDRYFATIVEPKFNIDKYRITAISNNELDIGSQIYYENVLPKQEIELKFYVYAGPQKLEDLQIGNNDYQKIMVFSNWGWLDTVAKLIYGLLGFTYKIIPIWGLCIIIVSIFIYALMYPLTLKSLLSMKRMQILQPKIKEIQEKYNKNPEKLNQEIMELYRKHGVNPLGGCLPMLLQMPIFVGLYQVLWRSFYFRGEKFLWIQDLSLPDRLVKLPVKLPFIGEYFNLLPVLMIGIMVLQQYFSSKNVIITDPQQATQQKIMTTFFPVFIGFIFYNFASGLNLYFVVFYLLSTLTQWRIAQDKCGV